MGNQLYQCKRSATNGPHVPPYRGRYSFEPSVISSLKIDHISRIRPRYCQGLALCRAITKAPPMTELGQEHASGCCRKGVRCSPDSGRS
jgi:hypothetical protein